MLVNLFGFVLCMWLIVYPSGMVQVMGRMTEGGSNRIGETAWRISGAIMLLLMLIVWTPRWTPKTGH